MLIVPTIFSHAPTDILQRCAEQNGPVLDLEECVEALKSPGFGWTYAYEHHTCSLQSRVGWDGKELKQGDALAGGFVHVLKGFDPSEINAIDWVSSTRTFISIITLTL